MENLESASPILIFTDGASSGNPGPGGWGSILVFPDDRVREMGGRELRTTNNRMELSAALYALESIQEIPAPAEILTDSTYLIRGITQWIWGWKKRGWVSAEGSEVLNQDLWVALDRLVQKRAITWKYVRGHAGIPGNERADEIAVAYSQGRLPSLYTGSEKNYSIPIRSIPEDTTLPDQKKLDTPKAKPYSYLSLVGQKAMRHSNWNDCEKRVKGQSGAKFKKAMSAKEEEQILRSWGVAILD